MEGVDELPVGPKVGEADEQPEEVGVGFDKEFDNVRRAGVFLAGLVPGAKETEGDEDGEGGEEEVGGKGGVGAGGRRGLLVKVGCEMKEKKEKRKERREGGRRTA